MEIIVNNLLFWLHFAGLGLGGVATFGLPVVGAQMPGATAETRPALFKVANGLTRIGRIGFGVLIVTGPILFWLKWSGSAPGMAWFTAKMVFVLLLLILIIVGGITSKRAQGGDVAAAKRDADAGRDRHRAVPVRPAMRGFCVQLERLASDGLPKPLDSRIIAIVRKPADEARPRHCHRPSGTEGPRGQAAAGGRPAAASRAPASPSYSPLSTGGSQVRAGGQGTAT